MYKTEKHFICRVCNKIVGGKNQVVMVSSKDPNHECKIGDMIEVTIGYDPIEDENNVKIEDYENSN